VRGTLKRMDEGAVVRRMREPKIAADVRQLRKCQLGYGLRNNRPDRAELHTGSHERLLFEEQTGIGVTSRRRKRRRTDRRSPLFVYRPARGRAPVPAFVSAGRLQNDVTFHQSRVMNAVDARKNDEAWLRGGDQIGTNKLRGVQGKVAVLRRRWINQSVLRLPAVYEHGGTCKKKKEKGAIVEGNTKGTQILRR
jgi:hypothetical protein